MDMNTEQDLGEKVTRIKARVDRLNNALKDEESKSNDLNPDRIKELSTERDRLQTELKKIIGLGE